MITKFFCTYGMIFLLYKKSFQDKAIASLPWGSGEWPL
jgi:hypothetical protein